MSSAASAPAHRSDGRLALLGWLWRAQAQAQPGRALTAVAAIAIGVSLALAIQLVNRSALAEFAAAMATVNGDAQAQIRPRAASFDERLYARLATDPAGASVSPVIEAEFALADRRDGALRVIGLDVFRAADVTPALLPSAPVDGEAGSGSPLFGDDTVFLSNAALAWLGLAEGDTLRLRAGAELVALRVAGRLPGVPAGQRLAVMDLGAMQWRLGWLGRLSRLDLRFPDGADVARIRARWEAGFPDDAVWSEPDASRQRMSNLSRAYRVNLNMLALVALFTGGFIVHATLALAVARQQRELALLGVLGARTRLLLVQVLGQGLLLGVAGAVIGSLGGVALASVLLSWVGGDLGGGYFAGSRPALSLDAPTLFGLAGAGVLTALLGALVPALAASRMPGARALRAGSLEETLRLRRGIAGLAWPLGCFAAGTALLALPPVAGLPWPSYLAIGAWLTGGIALVPRVVAACAHLLAKFASRGAGPVAWLAAHRLAGAPGSASAAMTGIVASFALAGAMAIMVASFRDSVDRWLETVLPADAYARIGSSTTRSTIDAPLQRRLAGAPGVTRAEFSRMLELTLDVARPPVVLIARPIDVHRPQSRLPITGEVRAPPPGTVAVYASEAVADLYGFVPGERVALPLPGASSKRDFFVAGIWRDYARQHGAIAIDAADYRTLTGDASVNDAALWLDDSREGTDAALGRLRTVLSDIEGLELRATGELRALSLRIFDRSFAVTYALEAIAILVALFGVASAWAAEGLARAREFGVLRHLGLRRRDVARLFAAEAALQIVLATAWGALLGTAIALILIHRVNPQSFHWTMDMSWPAGLLATVAVALLALGVAAAVLAARNAMSDAPVRAVREDW